MAAGVQCWLQVALGQQSPAASPPRPFPTLRLLQTLNSTHPLLPTLLTLVSSSACTASHWFILNLAKGHPVLLHYTVPSLTLNCSETGIVLCARQRRDDVPLGTSNNPVTRFYIFFCLIFESRQSCPASCLSTHWPICIQHLCS